MKQLLFLLLFLCSLGVFAQDVIVKKDGSTIVCRVIELTTSEITYKKWSDLNGSNYVMNRADASAINYENGKKVNLSDATNLYMPNNQNDGTQQFNDRALLQLDAAMNNPYKKVNSIKTKAWIGGVTMVGLGAVFYLIFEGSKEEKTSDDYWYNEEWALPVSLVCVAGGIAWTSYFLSKANKTKKMIDQNLTSIPVYQYNFNLSNGSTLSAGLNIINDHSAGERNLGLGLRYTF